MSDQPLPSAYQPPGYCPRCDYPTDWGTCPECGVFIPPNQMRPRPRGLLRRHISMFTLGTCLIIASLWYAMSREELVSVFPTFHLLALQQGDGPLVESAAIELASRFKAGELTDPQTIRFLRRWTPVNWKVRSFRLNGFGRGDGLATCFQIQNTAAGCTFPVRVSMPLLFSKTTVHDVWVAGQKVERYRDLGLWISELKGSQPIELEATLSIVDPMTGRVHAQWRDKYESSVSSPKKAWSPGREDLFFPYGRSPRTRFPADRIGEPDQRRG